MYNDKPKRQKKEHRNENVENKECSVAACWRLSKNRLRKIDWATKIRNNNSSGRFMKGKEEKKKITILPSHLWHSPEYTFGRRIFYMCLDFGAVCEIDLIGKICYTNCRNSFRATMLILAELTSIRK